MAWNEPGGNKNPWDRRPGQGPPDLDDIVRNWQRRLARHLRRAGPGGRAPGGAIAPQLGSDRAAVARRLERDRVLPGRCGGTGRRHALRALRADDAARVCAGTGRGRSRPCRSSTSPRTTASTTRRACSPPTRTSSTSPWRCSSCARDPIKLLFKVRAPEETLRDVSESAIREIIGQSKLDFVLGAGRQEITERTKELIQRMLDVYETGIQVITVNLTGRERSRSSGAVAEGRHQGARGPRPLQPGGAGLRERRGAQGARCGGAAAAGCAGLSHAGRRRGRGRDRPVRPGAHGL